VASRAEALQKGNPCLFPSLGAMARPVLMAIRSVRPSRAALAASSVAMVLLAPGRSSNVTVSFSAGPILTASTRLATVKDIEVREAHLGMAWNPAVPGAVADQLAEPLPPARL
jgi:hypothetical protein